jgi:ribosomal protein L23
MSLFAGKNKKEEVKEKALVSKANLAVNSSKVYFDDVILGPRVTEKSHVMSESSNVYVFNVKAGATKGAVKNAIKATYKVSPIKVSVVPIVRKTRFVRGKIGHSVGGRKVYVYLKKGEKLEVN